VSIFDDVLRIARNAIVKPAEDALVLARSGLLRPVPPKTVIELARQFRREGFKSHLMYTLYATSHPDKPAIVSEDRVITWAQLLDRIRRLANHFVSSGVGPGSSVVIMLPNRPPMAARVMVSGDSLVIESGPFESVLRKGVQVWTHGVSRLVGGELVGTTVAHYVTTQADSVVTLRTRATRVP